MDPYLSDKDQVEMIKKWWHDYGKAIVIAVAIGLLVGFGWRYYSGYRVQHAEQASQLFQQLAQMDDASKLDEAKPIAEEIVSNFANTPYASLASLVLAREAVSEKDLLAAEQRLQWVITHSKSDALKQIARLRLARVLVARFKASEALVILQTVDDDTYLPLIEAVRGDVYAGLNDREQSRKAYTAAHNGFKELGVPNPILDMKLAS